MFIFGRIFVQIAKYLVTIGQHRQNVWMKLVKIANFFGDNWSKAFIFGKNRSKLPNFCDN
jgi:hypothetical protein